MKHRLKYQLMAGLAVVCLLLFSTCCTTLPKFTSDQSLRAGSKVQMEDSHGPLSVARSKEIIDVLKARGAPSNFLDLHLAIEEAIVDSPLTTGNRVELLQDGPLTYQAMMTAINDSHRPHQYGNVHPG